MNQKKGKMGKKNLFKSRFHMFQNDWVAVFCQVTTVVSTPRRSVGGALFPLPNPAARRSLCGVSRGSSKSLAGHPQGFVQDSEDSD